MNKTLQQKLLKMKKKDQEARLRIQQKKEGADWDEIRKIDAKHIKEIKKIISQHGWPGRSLVGERGSFAAWLLAQHADHDLKFQKKALLLLKRAVENNEASKRDLAFLTDRVLVNQGKKQLYGTQFQEKGGKLMPQPIKGPEKLEQRRQQMGLEPFEEYNKKMQKYRK